MAAGPDDGDVTADRLAQALAAAEIGYDTVYADLTAAGALDPVVDGGVATVTVTLPVPSARLRASIAKEITGIARSIPEIEDVHVHWRGLAPNSGPSTDILPDVQHVIAVTSGKGGVGKSTVATNIAVALADAGARVGLLDADVYGPNAPRMLGMDGRTPPATHGDRIVPRTAHGVAVMSMGFIIGEDDPVIWRGSLVDDLLTQLFEDVEWGSLDYLIVDLPPGTGDAQLTLIQHVPVTGAIVVTTPQDVAVDDARRGVAQLLRYDVPVSGVIENMATFECHECGHAVDVFGAGGGDALAAAFDLPILAHIPLDGSLGSIVDDPTASSRGLDVPLLGTLRLPRTQAERGRVMHTPVAIREPDSPAGAALRVGASRLVARVAAFAAASDQPTD